MTEHNGAHERGKIARERDVEAVVAEKVADSGRDYREVTGKYDRIVSVGMMEPVGVSYFDEYFGKVRDLLTDDGYAMIHAIGRMTPPGTTGPFIRKYIFPGGYVPALSEVFASLERVGLWAADNEILRLHYYYTIKHWRERFAENREAAKALYDERFCRMWEFYLACCEAAFRFQDVAVFQVQCVRRQDAVPLTRDYIFERMHDLRMREAEHARKGSRAAGEDTTVEPLPMRKQRH